MPPLLSNLSGEEIKFFIYGQREGRIFKFPCHSQAVNSHAQLVTEASKQVCGQSARDGLVQATLPERKILPPSKQNASSKRNKVAIFLKFQKPKSPQLLFPSAQHGGLFKYAQRILFFSPKPEKSVKEKF